MRSKSRETSLNDLPIGGKWMGLIMEETRGQGMGFIMKDRYLIEVLLGKFEYDDVIKMRK
jgi:hypothetical protein